MIRTTGVARSIGIGIEGWFLEIVGLDEDADNRKATFRPQLQGALVKVVLACVEK